MNTQITILSDDVYHLPIPMPRETTKKWVWKVKLRDILFEITIEIGFKLSSRGWCYQLEGFNIITKHNFDYMQKKITELRKEGIIPVDLLAEDEGRKFEGVEEPELRSYAEFVKAVLTNTINCGKYYAPDWWKDEEYYIQMLVEKIDLKTLFAPICQEYHIPIGNARGWSSLRQLAQLAQRFKSAEQDGKQCVLLYFGDHDPDGLRISETLRANLSELKNIRWMNTSFEGGYDPKNLIIDRFGLNYNFIEQHDLTSIDNLITGSGKNLASPTHPNHNLDYVQDYIARYDKRKWEANSVVIIPNQARQLCRHTIEDYLGQDAKTRFQQKKQATSEAIDRELRELQLKKTIEQAIQRIDMR
ncbi:MAG: hypothetical protein ACXADH_16625 [Candidatus Kariarchaeaceae archaeon]|jgi:hypothetical protein